MKKFIDIKEAAELLDSIACGKRVEGVLFKDKNTGCITFKADRQSKTRHKDVLMKKTPWGWLKASLNRKKRYTSVPDYLTLSEKLAILDEENELVKQALVENYILETV